MVVGQLHVERSHRIADQAAKLLFPIFDQIVGRADFFSDQVADGAPDFR